MKITISASGKNNSVYSTKFFFISTEIFRSVYWHVRNFQWNRINTTAQYVQIIYIYIYIYIYIILYYILYRHLHSQLPSLGHFLLS